MTLNTFDVARMNALKEYATLEFQLCLLFKAILHVEAEIASAIFYQIINTRTRYAIMGSLLEIRHPDTFAKPWKRLEKWLGPCDTARNHIIHWGQDIRTTVYSVPMSPGASAVTGKTTIFQTRETKLLTNNARRWRGAVSGERSYTEGRIRVAEQDFFMMKNIINRFMRSICRPEESPWLDIFQQPIAHQTPKEFLSLLNGRGIPIPPESFPE